MSEWSRVVPCKGGGLVFRSSVKSFTGAWEPQSSIGPGVLKLLNDYMNDATDCIISASWCVNVHTGMGLAVGLSTPISHTPGLFPAISLHQRSAVQTSNALLGWSFLRGKGIIPTFPNSVFFYSTCSMETIYRSVWRQAQGMANQRQLRENQEFKTL